MASEEDEKGFEEATKDFPPEEMDLPIANSDCCNAPTSIVAGVLTCNECGNVCDPRT